MGAPTTICEDADGTTSDGNPCKLSPTEVGHGLGDWKYLLNFTPPAAVKADLKTRFGAESGAPPTVYHNINDASGVGINLDFYALQMLKLPNYPDGSPRDKKSALNEIRTHLNNYLNHVVADFNQYSSTDGTLWLSSNPLKAVMKFTMKIDLGVTKVTKDAGVVCAEITDDHWIFTTTWTKDTGSHPVTGNRQFGFAILKPTDTLPATYAGVNFTNRDQDVLYFYTRGVDRITHSAMSTFTPTAVFSGGENCWKGAMLLVLTWINTNGGHCKPAGSVSKRWGWDSDIKKKLWDRSPP